VKDEHTDGEKMARIGRKKVIYKGTFVSNQSLGAEYLIFVFSLPSKREKNIQTETT
jgi:hypothetical protein